MNNTYVKLYRSLLDHDTLSNDNTALIVFVKLLLKVDRHTGSITTGRFKLAAMTNLKPSTCWGALHRLETDSIVTLSPTGRNTTIRICNWATYQNSDRQQTDSKPTESRHETDTITRIKKENIDTNVSMDIDSMFSYWAEATGIEIVSKIKANRYACSNMLKKHGDTRLKMFVDGVKQAQADQYAPRIADFVQLQARLTELLTWGKSVKAKATPASIGGSAKKVSRSSASTQSLSRRELQAREYSS